MVTQAAVVEQDWLWAHTADTWFIIQFPFTHQHKLINHPADQRSSYWDTNPMLILRTESHFNNLSITLMEWGCSLPFKLFLQLCQGSTDVPCRLRRVTAAPVQLLSSPSPCPETRHLTQVSLNTPTGNRRCKWSFLKFLQDKMERGRNCWSCTAPILPDECQKPLNRPGKLSPSGKLTPREDSEGVSC